MNRRVGYTALMIGMALGGAGIWWTMQSGSAPSAAGARATWGGSALAEPANERDRITEGWARRLDRLQKKLEEQEERLDRALGDLRTQLARAQQPAGAGAPVTGTAREEGAEAPALSEEERRLRADAWYQSQVGLLEATFASQGLDLAWSEPTTHRLENAFADHRDLFTVEGISCGGLMCRLDARVVADPMAAGPGLDRLLHGDLGWEGQTMMRIDQETGETTVYLMREGAAMPVTPEG